MSASISALNSVILNGGGLSDGTKAIFLLAFAIAMLSNFPKLLKLSFPKLFRKQHTLKVLGKDKKIDIGSFGRSRTSEMLDNIQTPDLSKKRGDKDE